MEEVSRKFLGGFVGGISYMSVVVITFCTLYYNEFDGTMYSGYHIITQILGGGLVWSISWLIYAYLFSLPFYAVASLFCMVAYAILNISYSVLSIVMGDNVFAEIYPTIESFSSLVFGSVCTWIYVKSFFHGA